MASKGEADAESDGRLLEALFGGAPEAQEALDMDPDVASHMKLRVDDEGKPILLRFVYVDELTCIGCTYCAEVARSTFYMNEDAGRARVFNQHGDEPLVVQEAIDSCPVNCISCARRSHHEETLPRAPERPSARAPEHEPPARRFQHSCPQRCRLARVACSFAQTSIMRISSSSNRRGRGSRSIQ